MTGHNKVVSGLILVGSSVFLCRVSETLVESAEGAVLIAVQGGASGHVIVPWVLIVRVPQLRAEGRISEGALSQRNHCAHSVRKPQKALVTTRVNDVGVGAALGEGVVRFGTARLLWDIRAPDHCVKFKDLLCLQNVCCFLMRHHPALQKEDLNSRIYGHLET